MLGHGAVGELALGQIPGPLSQVNTRQRRSAAINVTSPWRSLLPAPDGAVSSADRAQVALHYTGVSPPAVTAVAVTDSFSITLSDVLAILCQLSRNDSISITLSDFLVILASLSRSDGISVTISDVLAILGQLSRSDDIDVTLSDVLAILGQLSRSDDATVVLTGTVVSILAALSRSDDASVVTSDVLAILASLERSDSVPILLEDRLFLTRRNRPRSAIVSVGAGEIAFSMRASRPLSEIGASGDIAVGVRTARPLSDVKSGSVTTKIRH